LSIGDGEWTLRQEIIYTPETPWADQLEETPFIMGVSIRSTFEHRRRLMGHVRSKIPPNSRRTKAIGPEPMVSSLEVGPTKKLFYEILMAPLMGCNLLLLLRAIWRRQWKVGPRGEQPSRWPMLLRPIEDELDQGSAVGRKQQR